ncbi:MAG TPA: hypothetical protein VE244_03360 [Nitrososphaeraceae archaeon]|jgi:hypothetical protein|nr:hypothetical protein [Nitrososphaeraceae archaeon]
MNSKRVVATNHTIKQMFKRCQDFEHMLLTSDLDLALDDKYLELDKTTKRVGRLARRVTASIAAATTTTTTKKE